MNLSSKDVDQLRSAFAVCRIAGIDAVVVTDNKVRGITPTSKQLILSEVDLSIDPSIKIGIGRIGELEKRLSVFGTEALDIVGKMNDNGEVTVLTIGAGRSKLQFRCTSEKMIKYPKANHDEPVARITATKDEIQRLARAIKTLGAETVSLGIGRDSSVKFECVSPTNESFVTSLEASATFENDPQGIVHIYEGDRFATILDAAAREMDPIELVLGDVGTLALKIRTHEVVIMPEANQEDDDE